MKLHRLIAIVVTVALATASAPVTAQEKSWVGELVIATKQAKDVHFWDRLGDRRDRFDLPFSGRWPLKIRDDRNGLLRLHDGVREGWANKADFVLVSDAPAYFHARVQANPKDTWALLMRGAAWLAKGVPDNALQDFNEYIRLNPNDAAAFNNRGLLWSAKKEYDKALKDYDQAIRLDAQYVDAFCNRGLAWRGKKAYDKAIQDFNEAIRLDPRVAFAFNSRGSAWLDKKEYDKAIDDYDEAVKLDPKYVEAFNKRGNAWLDKKEYDKAIEDYDEAIRLDPRFASAYSNRGNAWLDKKEYDKAIEDYELAIRLNPKDALGFNNRGDAWRMKRQYDKAIGDYDEAIRLDPKYVEAFNRRGLARSAKKEYDKAIRDFDEAIRLAPKYAWPLYCRSLAYLLARRPGATDGFQAVLELEGWKGNLSPYTVILGHLAARQAGDEPTASRFLKDSAGQLNESWPHPVVRYLCGNIDEATLLQAATDDDKKTAAHCYLGFDLALRGRKDEALAHYRWVKEHGTVALLEYTIALAGLERLESKPYSPSAPSR